MLGGGERSTSNGACFTQGTPSERVPDVQPRPGTTQPACLMFSENSSRGARFANLEWKEMIMSAIRRSKLTDALNAPKKEGDGGKGAAASKRQREPSAEQTREAQESGGARGAVASSRERMVDIGRGNQQAGRQGRG